MSRGLKRGTAPHTFGHAVVGRVERGKQLYSPDVRKVLLDPEADDYLTDRPRARQARRRPATRNCVNCGREFRCPPSDRRTRTCSKECSSAHRRRKHYGVRNVWSDEGRANARKAAERTGNLKLGTVAARSYPHSGPFETNINAKEWLVVAPGGAPTYEVRNLRLWCEKNAELFAPDHWQNAYAGLRQVSAWLRGKTKRQVSSWKGWTIEAVKSGR